MIIQEPTEETIMIYRTADPKDLETLQALALAAYGRLKIHMTPENWTTLESVLLSDQTFPLLVKTCHGFICEKDSSLLGMAFLVPRGNPTKIYGADTSYIRMVGVHPDAGGQGIAQTLAGLCIDKARASGEKTVSLHTADIMYAARHIYEKLGFKKIRMLDSNYGLAYGLYQLELR